MNMFEEKPILHQATFEFSQEKHTWPKQDEETLTIEMISANGSLDEEAGYYVIKTSEWAINSVEELENLFNQIKNIKH